MKTNCPNVRHYRHFPNLLVLCLEPEPAVTDCWAQGAVPKVFAPPRKSLLSQDVDVFGGGDASIAAASPAPDSQSLLVFIVIVSL